MSKPPHAGHLRQAATVACNIRHATAGDAREIADLGARVFRSTFADETSPKDMASFLATTYSETQLAKELADPKLVFFVYMDQGAITGFAQTRNGPVEACIEGPAPVELQRLYVDPKQHGRGVAQALMETSLAWAVAHQYRTVWLGVAETNLRAQRFYQKYGFRVCGKHLFYVGQDPQVDLLMEAPLS